MLCTDMTLVGYGPSVNIAEPLKCGRWGCPNCEDDRKRRLFADVLCGHPDTFITLTSNPQWFDTPDARARALRDAWRNVKKLAEKESKRDPRRRPKPHGVAPQGGWTTDQHGRVHRKVRLPNHKLYFIAIFEQTKLGEPHLHICARSQWLDQEWLSAQMAYYIGARIVDVRRIANRNKAAKYVAQYTKKAPKLFDGCKRYWRSIGYKLEERSDYAPQDEDGPRRYEVVFRNFWAYVEDLRHVGGFLGVRDYIAYWMPDPRGANDPP